MPLESALPPESPVSTHTPVWLGRCAAWGMPLAYVVAVAAAALGLRVPGIGAGIFIKIFLGGAALWPLRKFLKKAPQNSYALTAHRIVIIQLGMVLCLEMLTWVLFLLISEAAWPAFVMASVLVAFAFHILVAICGSRRLRAMA